MTVDHPRDLLSTSSSLTLVGATRREAALAQARSMRQQFCIAVTDPSGEPIVTLRMDGAPRISAGIALNKAYTVCGFGGMPTESWNTRSSVTSHWRVESCTLIAWSCSAEESGSGSLARWWGDWSFGWDD